MQNEIKRLASLKNLRLLDTLPSESFDRITRLAANIFGLPIAAVSLTDTDRQWFKSKVGVDHNEIPRERAPCAVVAEKKKLLVVKDFREDEFFSNSHLGTAGIRFYAGAPLITPDGYGLGALCVLGTEAREVTPQEVATLRDLAAMVMDQIELTHAVGRIEASSGLPNRFQLLADLVEMSQRKSGTECIVSLLDLAQTSQFERLSRVLGPSYFDDVIKEVVQILREQLGATATLYQLGPTQFAFFAPAGISREDFIIRSEKKLEEIKAQKDFQVSLTPSIGVVAFDPAQMTPEDVLRSMQSAAQDARESFKKIGLFSPSMDMRHRRNFSLLQDFGSALESQDQLSLVFQPRLDLNSGEIKNAEALIRWDHPVFGSVSPAEFIPIVEASPFARKLTDWVLDEALKTLSQWEEMGLDFKLSINLSALNLEEDDFFERLIDKMATYQITADRLELELTETAMMKETDSALGLLNKLKTAGVKLAIDDFGTGYSSIAYLQKLPADIVKIDRFFIRDMESGNRERMLVRSMIELAQSLGYRVVAEGVETPEAMALLKVMGCDEIQGYWLAKPMKKGAIGDWLMARQSLATFAA